MYFLGVDWGGTRIKLGAVSADGALLRHETLESTLAGDVEQQYSLIVKHLHQMAAELGRPDGIGLALTGPTAPERGVVLLPGKIKGMEGFPIVPRLAEEFGVPVRADNDGRAAMFAEKYVGHARDKRWAVTLTIGTGIGSGVMLDRVILCDPHLQFGTQIGHLVLDYTNDQLCLTGARGTAEMLCSATSLVLSVRSGLQRGIPSVLTERYLKDPRSVDFRAIFDEGVAKGDLLCADELRRWTLRLGWLLVNVAHAYAPEVIILAGGAAGAAAWFIDDLRRHVAAHIFRYLPNDPVPILTSTLGDHIGVIGAALMLQEYLQDRQRGR